MAHDRPATARDNAVNPMSPTMTVHLSFDVEVWCNGWSQLDATFPGNFERYVFGHSRHGDYALPKTLEVLNRHGLHGVFFVEPLFAARFGVEHLRTIVALIREAGQEIQLHIHPEWTDEISPPILDDVSRKRQHLSYYSGAEQTALIAFAKQLLESAGSGPIDAFRAGSYAANLDTYEALRRNGIRCDSSLNRCFPISAPELRARHGFIGPFEINDVCAFPVSVLIDGFGRERPAQIGACGSAELRQALLDARDAGMSDFVVVSHNFEMLKPGTVEPDWIVVRRFESLCQFLADHCATLPTGGYAGRPLPEVAVGSLPRASFAATLTRHGEQLLRRIT